MGKWSLLETLVLFNDLIVIGATQMLVIVKVTIKARRGFDRQTQVALGVAPGQLLIGHYRNVADAISGSDARQLAGAELTWRSLRDSEQVIQTAFLHGKPTFCSVGYQPIHQLLLLRCDVRTRLVQAFV